MRVFQADRQMLYAQKLWSFLLPKLLAGEEGASGAAREPYLLAFAALLPLVPASLYLSDLRKVSLPHTAN